jgi:hypothetical protein
MNSRWFFLAAVVTSLVIAASWTVADEAKKEFKPKCPVSGKAAKSDCTVDYQGGKVHLCCPGCVAPFKKDTDKFAAKANHQLVGTGQAKQKGCPLTGGKCNPSTALEVAGINVCFCCNGCRGKVAGAESDEQVEKVFGKKAFAKAFKVAAK